MKSCKCHLSWRGPIRLCQTLPPTSLFTIPVPFQQCGFWSMGCTELQYWALLPGKPKSGSSKSCSQLGTPTTESSCSVTQASPVDHRLMVISVAIQEPMTWREVRLCLDSRYDFSSSWLKQILTLKKVFFLEEHRWNILGIMWTPGYGWSTCGCEVWVLLFSLL